MTNTAQITPAISLAVVNGKPVTTSLDVADRFSKDHKSVLRTIRQLDCSPEFTERNFAPSNYTDPTGRKLVMFHITRDGFVFLAMGFTGKEAAKWKEAYINAFNQMEAELLKRSEPRPKKAPKALPGAISLEQQAAVKELVLSRVNALPNEVRAKAAIRCWSALKTAFSVKTYKEISEEYFGEALSLVARLPLEGEFIPAADPEDRISHEQARELGRRIEGGVGLMRCAMEARNALHASVCEMAGVAQIHEISRSRYHEACAFVASALPLLQSFSTEMRQFELDFIDRVIRERLPVNTVSVTIRPAVQAKADYR